MHTSWSLSVSEAADSLEENQISTWLQSILYTVWSVLLCCWKTQCCSFWIFKLQILCLLLRLQCGRITGLNCKNGIDLEQVTWPEMGVHGARHIMQLQQQFWHGDIAHPHQVASQWEKRGDGHPPVFSNSSPSLFGYDLTSSGKSFTPSYTAFLTDFSCLSLTLCISALLGPWLLSLFVQNV